MSYLIFCSFEVGGLPYKMADILNSHGIKVFYLSIANDPTGHDSSQFHYGTSDDEWNLSPKFKGCLSNNELKTKLINIRKEYNITNCFATGTKSYLLSEAGINYSYWSYGSDLDNHMPIWDDAYPLSKKCLRLLLLIFFDKTKVRRTFHNAQRIMIAPYQIKTYNKICHGKKLFFLPHFLIINDYNKILHKKQEIKKNICSEINANKFFFSATRHFWSGYRANLADNKGNNVIIVAFKKYLELSGNHNSKLVLIEKGPDVSLSKALSDDLKITRNVVWLKEMKREELNKYYIGSDITFGQFGTPVLTNASLEPLANATICISLLGENDERVPFYHSSPPIFSSKDPEKIANYMIKILDNPKEYNDTSYNCWLWVKINCSEEKFVESFQKIMCECIEYNQEDI